MGTIAKCSGSSYHILTFEVPNPYHVTSTLGSVFASEEIKLMVTIPQVHKGYGNTGLGDRADYTQIWAVSLCDPE